VIIVVSSSPREARALVALVANQPRAVYTCTSIAQFKAQLRKVSPAVVLTRAGLVDGYSDDIIALLTEAGFLPGTKIVVLIEAGCTPRQEARQLALGADCVLRDPLRPEVLLEYTAKFTRAARETRTPAQLPPDQFTLAGATFLPGQQTLSHRDQSIHVAPMEIELARLLADSPGKTLTYQLLYSELLNRTFSGDSSNLRVLLGKLVASYRKLGLDLRASIKVMPKAGYCYNPPPTPAGRKTRSR
jgi:DNA-binding response OmpR family regulator